MNKTKKRPVNLDLIHMHMPVAAIVSILHRLSGVLLIILLPYGIYLFEMSLSNEQGFLHVQALLCSVPGKVITVGLGWVFFHHLCAGIRFLLIDIDIGVAKESSVKGAWMVHAGAILLTLIVAVMLL